MGVATSEKNAKDSAAKVRPVIPGGARPTGKAPVAELVARDAELLHQS